MGNQQKAYYAIIPADVRYDTELPPNAKLLYGEITALCNEKGYCWATNDYFANLYGVSKTSVSKWIAALIKKGYISSEIVYKEGTKEILNRYLKIVKYPIEEKLNTPIEEKLKENNTSINNTINNTNNKRFNKPSIDEIKQYCLERNNNVNAEVFYDFYESKDWFVGKNKMKDWKAAVRTWERRDTGKRKEPVPKWLNKEVKYEPASDDEIKELEEMFKPYKDDGLAKRVEALKERLK